MGPRTMQRAMIEGFLFGRQAEARITSISDPETGAVLQHDVHVAILPHKRLQDLRSYPFQHARINSHSYLPNAGNSYGSPSNPAIRLSMTRTLFCASTARRRVSMRPFWAEATSIWSASWIENATFAFS